MVTFAMLTRHRCWHQHHSHSTKNCQLFSSVGQPFDRLTETNCLSNRLIIQFQVFCLQSHKVGYSVHSDIPSLLFREELWSHPMDESMDKLMESLDESIGWVRLRLRFTRLVLLKATLMPNELWSVNMCDNEVMKTIDSKQLNRQKQLIWKTTLKPIELSIDKRAPNILNHWIAMKTAIFGTQEESGVTENFIGSGLALGLALAHWVGGSPLTIRSDGRHSTAFAELTVSDSVFVAVSQCLCFSSIVHIIGYISHSVVIANTNTHSFIFALLTLTLLWLRTDSLFQLSSAELDCCAQDLLDSGAHNCLPLISQ